MALLDTSITGSNQSSSFSLTGGNHTLAISTNASTTIPEVVLKFRVNASGAYRPIQDANGKVSCDSNNLVRNFFVGALDDVIAEVINAKDATAITYVEVTDAF